MKVLQIASGDLWAGAEVQLFNLCLGLARDPRVVLRVALLNEGELADRLRRHGIEVSVYDESRLPIWRIYFGLLNLVRGFRPDVLHSHRIKENILGCLAALGCADSRCVTTAHGAPEHGPSLRKPLRRFALGVESLLIRRRMARIIAVSEPLAEQLKQQFPASRVVVIPNGIDIQDLTDRARGGASLPARAGRLAVGLVARLVPVKRADLFLKMAAELDRRQPKRFAFYILGDGPQLGASQLLANELAVDAQFLGFRPDAPKLVAQLDFLCILSDHEGLPMNLLEALALGAHVVAHAVGGIPQVIHHCGGGTLVDSQNPSDYADAIEQAVSGGERQLERAAVRAAVERHYRAASNAQAHVQLYLDIKAEGGAD